MFNYIITIILIYNFYIITIKGSVFPSFTTPPSQVNDTSDPESFIEIPISIKEIPFICYGISNDTSLYLNGYTNYYQPYSTLENNSLSYYPNNCSTILKSDKNQLSCCLNNNKKSFESVINYINSDKVMGGLIDCQTNQTLKGGFKTVSDNGETPDLVTYSEQVSVWDSRESVKICIDQLLSLQCFRCSQDHRIILRDFPNEISSKIQINEIGEPLFYIKSSSTLNETTTTTTTTTTIGKTISLCNDYYETLMSHCQYLKIRDILFNQLYKPIGEEAIFGESRDFINKFGIFVPKLDEFTYMSTTDYLDLFYVSNFNCFKQSIPKFEQPTCTLIVDNKWRENPNKDIIGNLDDKNSNLSSSFSIYNTPLLTLLLILVLFIK